MTRRRRLAPALATLAALGACAAGTTGTRADTPPPRPVVLLAAGESLGNLEPCHCVQGMHGGFARRLSALARERGRGEVVAVDGGDLTGRELHPRLLEAKTRAALDLLAQGQVAAMVVGEKDLRLGHAPLLRAAQTAGVTLLAANLTDAAGARPFAATKRVTVSGRALVLAGVLDDALGDPTGQLAAGDPDEAARAAFAGAPEGALRVLLFHGSRERAKEALAPDLPVDVVVCGHERDATRPLERHGRAWLVETLRDARGLARLEVVGGEVALSAVTLDGQVPDDAQARRRIDRYYQEVAGLPEPERRPVPEGGELVGSSECQGCHVEAWDTFVTTKHHASYAHVQEKDPRRAGLFECVGCHVTGHGFEGGFRAGDETVAHLAEVGCESCHGVGGNHVETQGRGYGVKAGFPESWRATCVGCHDASNSPHFDFAEYMARIKHWSDR